jgi:hypothetical protein
MKAFSRLWGPTTSRALPISRRANHNVHSCFQKSSHKNQRRTNRRIASLTGSIAVAGGITFLSLKDPEEPSTPFKAIVTPKYADKKSMRKVGYSEMREDG